MSNGSPGWEKQQVKIGKLVLRTLAIVVLVVTVTVANSQEPATVPAASGAQTAPQQTANQGPAASAEKPSAEAQGAAPLRVLVGKSLLINTTERLRRVSVTDPTVADALVVTPTQILVHGRSAGEVSLIIWDELERSRSFDLRVDVDVSATAEEEKRVFPDEQIEVTPSRSAIGGRRCANGSGSPPTSRRARRPRPIGRTPSSASARRGWSS